MGGAIGPPDEGTERWEALEIEGDGWRDGLGSSGPFTLDEDEEEEAAALLPSAAAATATAASRGAGPGPSNAAERLRRAMSRPSLAAEDEQDSWATVRHELGRIAQLALPMCISQFFNFVLSMVTVAFIGRLGEEEMAATVLATSFMNVTGMALVLGFLGALDTLCGQAWGAKNYPALGVTLQQAIVTTLLTTAAVCLLWANVEWLLLAAGQQAAIAAGAARFMLLATPALICAGMFECLKRYLMAQGIVNPVTIVSCAAVVLAPLYNWLLIFKAGLGLDGAVYAMVASYLTMLCMLSGYVVWHERRRKGTPMQTWHGWSRDCLKGLGTYYRLAIPSTLMVCLEWWAYELTIFLAGWLPDPTLHVSVMGILMQVSGLCYMFPLGLSCAASVRVSNALGAGLPHAARRSAHASVGLTACCQAMLAAALVLGRGTWGGLFTNLPEVIAACAAIFPLMAVCLFGDGMSCVSGGVLRGAGRQELGAALNLGSYWGLGLPAAYLLAFKAGWGIKGLWSGLVLCTSVQGVVMLVVLARFNWQKEAQRAADLLAKAADSINDGSGTGGSEGAGSYCVHGGSEAGAAVAGADAPAGVQREDSALEKSAGKVHPGRGSKDSGRPAKFSATDLEV